MRYTRPKALEWVYPVMDGYRLRCCDCGLVHNVDFQVIKKSRTNKAGYFVAKPAAGWVSFRVTRNERATAATRRRKK